MSQKTTPTFNRTPDQHDACAIAEEYRPIQVKRAIERLHLGSRAEALIFGANLARIYGM